MAYKVSKHNAFQKGIKKLDPQFKNTVADECQNIQDNPSMGETMKGNLKKLDIRKVSVKNTNPEFRILYKVYNCDQKNYSKLTCEQDVTHESQEELKTCNGLVDFIICGPREMFNNFYKLPLDKLKKYI